MFVQGGDGTSLRMFAFQSVKMSHSNVNLKFLLFNKIILVTFTSLSIVAFLIPIVTKAAISKETSSSDHFLIHSTSSFIGENQKALHHQNEVNGLADGYAPELIGDDQFNIGSAEGNTNRNKQHESNDYYYPDSSQSTNDPQSSNNDLNHDFIAANSLSILNQFNRLPDKEYLSHDVSEKACRLDRGCQRKDRLNNTYLSYCTRYKLENLLSNDILMSIMHNSSEDCERILDEFIQLDELINQFDRLFKNLLTRYNCHNGYSVKWSCDDCKKAYKDWLCATSLPYYMNGERIKPCISFCERVEQRCPYLHPITKEQYGGQPVFICRDPNIPFVPEITPDIPYSEPSKCYDLCHLSENLTELIADSLSKYEFDKCPDKGHIAEEVRSDPLYCKLEPHMQSNGTKALPDDQFYPNTVIDYSTESSVLQVNDSLANRVSGEKLDHNIGGMHVHNRKLYELREVLAIYKSQPKTHKFGHHSDHSSLTVSAPHAFMSHHEKQSAWSPHHN